MSTEIVGLRIKCGNLGKTVNIARGDFAIGPLKKATRNYVIRCACGSVHKVATQHVTKPTKTRRAEPIAEWEKR